MKLPLLCCVLSLAFMATASAQVLGPCGTADAEVPGAAVVQAAPSAVVQPQSVSRVPLPGEKAPNFELAALFPNNVVKKVKLSDYDGKWRVVCFYPADFTFV